MSTFAGRAIATWFEEMKWANAVLRRADEAATAGMKQPEVLKDAVKVADDTGPTAAAKADSCLTNSFTPETRVLMADGSYKDIGDVEPGDEVLATDPDSDETACSAATLRRR